MAYKFYKGRLLVYEDKYSEALEELEWALKHCHAKVICGCLSKMDRVVEWSVTLGDVRWVCTILMGVG